MFEGFDLKSFWEKSAYADKTYVDNPLTDEKVKAVEEKLGYKLPAAYVELMRAQNGGVPVNTRHRTKTATSWSEDHVALTGFYSIGSVKECSLCGLFTSQFWIDEWGYPAIGIYFADCPSAGHDLFCLDYTDCGATGEPRVVHVDQERDYEITLVAPDFESFVRGLEHQSEFQQ
jgi:hypothetical protein